MAVMSLPPEGDLEPKRYRAGGVYRTTGGFLWQFMRKGIKYRGPVVATRQIAWDALDVALDALDRGEQPIVAPALDSTRTRARTIDPKALLRLVKKSENEEWKEVEYPDVERPITRGDCASMPRPCPFVSCSHHLYLDVNPETGSIKLNFPHLEVWEMPETCSLDVADKGGVTLEEVGRLSNLTRERIRQYEVRALAKIRDADAGGHLGVPPGRP